MSEDAKAATAPYVSFRTFLSLLDRLHSDGIPQHVDRHYWGGFLAGGVGQQMMLALRFLGLINPDSNEPTSNLERLVAPEDRKSALRDLLRECYAAVWDSGVDPARTTPGHLEGAFGRLYRVEGETRRKAVTFFVHAAKHAELPLSSQITAKTRQRRTSSNSTTRPRSKGGQSRSTPPTGQEQSPAKKEVPLAHQNGPYTILHSWLYQLPPEGRWTAERRDRWLTALQANVDYLITIDEDGQDEEYEMYEEETDETLSG